MGGISHWWFWFTGARDEPGTAYGIWSGFGGAVPDIMIPAGVLAWYVKNTCHASLRCLRWGKFPAAGGMFRLCHHHHPDLQGARPHRDLIHRMHHEQAAK